MHCLLFLSIYSLLVQLTEMIYCIKSLFSLCVYTLLLYTVRPVQVVNSIVITLICDIVCSTENPIKSLLAAELISIFTGAYKVGFILMALNVFFM